MRKKRGREMRKDCKKYEKARKCFKRLSAPDQILIKKMQECLCILSLEGRDYYVKYLCS